MRSVPARLPIRRMTPDDIPWAIGLAAQSAHAPHWAAAAYLAALDGDASPRRIALVAEMPTPAASSTHRAESRAQPETRIAFAIASLLPPHAELETILVVPTVRRRGIGRAIFAALSHQFQNDNVTEVTLEVRCSNHPALALYAALSFTQAGLRPGYYTDPKEDALIMRLDLDSSRSPQPTTDASV